MSKVLEKIGGLGLVPVVAIDRSEDAAALGDALTAGGLPCAEITFRTAAAADAIAAMSKHDPNMLVGAGTVLNVEQAKRAIDSGAKFIVSPGFSAKVVAYCQQQNVPITPGIATPTELTAAIDAGLSVVKFFPAEAIGGLKLLKALSAPFGGVKFIPTGGIDAENIQAYLKHPAVLACGGSWIVKSDLIRGGQFDEITRLTTEAMQRVREAKSQ